MSSKEILVEMANYTFGESPQVLIAKGLGSCLAITFYHRATKTGALSHVMLPNSKESSVGGRDLRFVDCVVNEILTKFTMKKIEFDEIEAKIIGGANMFPFLNREVHMYPSMGKRNMTMARYYLRQKKIVIVGEDVGGHYGRSVRFHLDTGIITVEKKI